MKKTFFLLIILLSSFAFTDLEKGRWYKAIINPSIKKDTVFQRMNMEGEYSFGNRKLFNNDSVNKRTSHVSLFNGIESYFQENTFDTINGGFLSKNVCHAFFLPQYKDTLTIRLSHSDGLTANGIIIKYYLKKYNVQWFDMYDVSGPDGKNTYYTYDDSVVFQKIILNKDDFKRGDSIYGYVNYKAFRKDSARNLRFVTRIRGYFRTLIK